MKKLLWRIELFALIALQRGIYDYLDYITCPTCGAKMTHVWLNDNKKIVCGNCYESMEPAVAMEGKE